VMMLRWLGLTEAAQHFDRALMQLYGEGKVRTTDLGGTATTSEFTDAIIAALSPPGGSSRNRLQLRSSSGVLFFDPSFS
jgi:hypothetical protein